MYKTILVPLDGSELASAALLYAGSLAKSVGAAVVLLRVTPAPGAIHSDGRAAMLKLDYQSLRTAQSYSPEDKPLRTHEHLEIGHPQPPWIEHEMAEADRYLIAISAQLMKLGIPTQTLIRPDDIAGTILDVADEIQADMIVMASHGRGGIGRFLLGSVADRVVHHAKVPVLLIRPTITAGDDKSLDATTSFRKILVPLDGSELATRVLPHVQQLASLSGAEVTLFRSYLDLVGSDDAPDPEIARQTAGSYLQVIADNMSKQSIHPHTLIERGRAAECILDVAESMPADLIAMSTHGRSGITRFLMGSVADRVARHAHIPVLLVR